MICLRLDHGQIFAHLLVKVFFICPKHHTCVHVFAPQMALQGLFHVISYSSDLLISKKYHTGHTTN